MSFSSNGYSANPNQTKTTSPYPTYWPLFPNGFTATKHKARLSSFPVDLRQAQYNARPRVLVQLTGRVKRFIHLSCGIRLTVMKVSVPN